MCKYLHEVSKKSDYEPAAAIVFHNFLVNKYVCCRYFVVYCIEQNGYAALDRHSLSYLARCEKKVGDPCSTPLDHLEVYRKSELFHVISSNS